MKTKSNFIKQAAIAAVVIALLAGCKSDKYNFLSEEDLTWMVYSVNQTLKFKNDSGDIRLYTISGVFRGYKGDEGSTDEHVNALIVPSAGFASTSSNGILEVVRRSAGAEVVLTWPFFSATAYISSLVPTVDTIGGVPFSDVYTINVLVTDSVNTIEQLKYSRAKGCVQYTEYSGETWTLSN